MTYNNISYDVVNRTSLPENSEQDSQSSITLEPLYIVLPSLFVIFGIIIILYCIKRKKSGKEDTTNNVTTVINYAKKTKAINESSLKVTLFKRNVEKEIKNFSFQETSQIENMPKESVLKKDKINTNDFSPKKDCSIKKKTPILFKLYKKSKGDINSLNDLETNDNKNNEMNYKKNDLSPFHKDNKRQKFKIPSNKKSNLTSQIFHIKSSIQNHNSQLV